MEKLRLRFRRDDATNFSDWTEVCLEDVGEIRTGTTPNIKDLKNIGGSYLWVTPTDITGKEVTVTATTLSKEGMDVAREIPANSVLVTCIASIGKNCVLRNKGSCNQQINSITPKFGYDVDFLYYLICRKESVLHSFAGHGGMEILNKSEFSKLIFKFPSFEEQQKIAAFFTALDEKIRLSEQKLNLISKIKKGIAQKLFAQDLRFQSYNKPWKEKNTLSQIAVVTMGQSPSSESYNEDSEGLPLIQGNADIVDGFTKPQRYTTEVTKRCQEGDVILSVRAPVGELGIASEESCIGRGVCAIRANDKSNTVFIYQFLQAKKKQWKTLEQGSTFTAVSGEDIKTFEVLVPTKEEQQKIAAFFTAFDKKIDIEKKKLNELHRLKTAFMQQMFV